MIGIIALILGIVLLAVGLLFIKQNRRLRTIFTLTGGAAIVVGAVYYLLVVILLNGIA